MTTEHRPWVGKRYATGINGQQIAIVGYSHYLREGSTDSDGVTEDTIECVLKSDPFAFFRKVRSYFRWEDCKEFWGSVVFFNFLPNSVGTRDRRYAYGTPGQIERGQSRVQELIDSYAPNKIFVFTKKGWSEFPPTNEERRGGECAQLDAEVFPRFTWGTYGSSSISTAFGLRHPQYANAEEMTKAVGYIMALPSA